METEREFMSEHGCYSVVSESTGDYTLPDYNTDVKRMLLTRAEAVGAGAFPSGDDLEVAGVVNYEVIYLDSENEITSCSFSCDYDLRVRCNTDALVGAQANSRVTGYTVRLTGPRKFSVKAQLATDAHITERGSLSVGGGATVSEGAQLRTKEAMIARRIYCEPKERELAMELGRLDGVIADDVSVLYTDCLPDVNASVGEGGVALSGTLNLRALIKREGELPELVEGGLPFEETLDCTRARVDSAVNPDVKITSVKVSVDPTEDGVVLMASVIIECTAAIVMNEQVPVVLDCYLTDREVTNGYGEMSYTRHLGVLRADPEIEISVPREEVGATNVRQILLMSALCKPDELKSEGDGVIVRGIMRFSGVACEVNEAGELGYTGIKFDRPFETSVKCGSRLPDGVRLCCTPMIKGINAIVSDTEISSKVALSFLLDVQENMKMTRLVTSIAGDDPIKKDGVTVCVYYPTDGESLYDVGRKFHTPVLDIAADNSLTEEVFASDGGPLTTLGVKRLVIR